MVSDAARAALQLHLADGVGSLTFSRLVARFGSPAEVAKASAAALAEVERIGRRTAENIHRQLRDPARLDAELTLAERLSIDIVCEQDQQYPSLLRHVADPPPVLYVRGTLEPADAAALAIVGTREPTRYGLDQADRFAGLAATAGLTVVSGLARGIDVAAHRGSLRSGGRTIAVLGNGLASIYPPEHADLASEVAAAGAVISEFPLNTRPDTGTFPRRNRVVAGMTLGTLVVEGSITSGALITARFAHEYNREVFAIPGRVDERESAGPNELIRRGEAALVTQWSDLLEALGEAGRGVVQAVTQALPGASPGETSGTLFDAKAQPASDFLTASTPTTPAPRELPANEQAVLDALARGSADCDELMEFTGLAVHEVLSAAAMLQIKGLVREQAGQRFARK